jgi:hypothetical protein
MLNVTDEKITKFLEKQEGDKSTKIFYLLFL